MYQLSKKILPIALSSMVDVKNFSDHPRIAKEVVQNKENGRKEAICDSLGKTELLKLHGFEQLMSRFVQFGLSYVVTTRGWVSCIGIMGTGIFCVFF
jgi:hypothetical protein